MLNFKDYESFLQYIKSDAKKADINSVRFINVETMQMWVQVKTFLIGFVQGLIKLSDFCENDDIAPNLNRFKKSLRMLSENTLVLPLSEYLRINRPLASKTITDVLHTNFENNFDGKLRIYVLLYRMKDVLSSLQLDPRKINAISSINQNSESDYSLTIVQKALHLNTYGNEIDGFKKYFIYWEQNPDKPIILRTKNAINYADIVFSDNVEVIVSSYDLLRHFGLSTVLQKEAGTDDQWEKLAIEYSASQNIDIAIGKMLSVIKYNDDLFSNWNSYDSFKRWLLWIWAKINSKNEYLRHIFKKTSFVDEFEYAVYSGIVDFLNDRNYARIYQLRKDVLIKLNLSVDVKHFGFCIGLDAVKKMKCLTDSSTEERIEIIKTIADIPNWESTIELLKTSYPLTYAYLQPSDIGYDAISAYFDAYKRCKITNCATAEFLMLVNQFANEYSKSVWQFKSRNLLVDQWYNDDATILFVDAFGVEYTEALISCFDDDLYNIEIAFGHCNMPSTTKQNNDFYKGKNHLTPFYGLDEWKHSTCTFPKSIEQELELLKKIKTQVDKGLNTKKTVIIATDHGTSRLAVIAKGYSHKVSEAAEKYKYGRYCVDSTSDYSDLPGCVYHDDFWIFANYDKFKQSGSPTCEIHGGASLEEMIVPVICISRKDDKPTSTLSKKVKAKLILLTPEIKLSISKEVQIQFTCSTKLHNTEAHVDNKTLLCVFENGIYSFSHRIDSPKSEYTAKIISDGSIVGELKYKVIRPMEQRKNFDI